MSIPEQGVTCKKVLARQLDRRVLVRLRETCVMVEVVGSNQRDRVVYASYR